MKYDKLVRDKIPEIIKRSNENPKIHIASEEEYEQKLKEKLLEEVKEFNEENTEEELADILEVIYAICDLKKINKEKIEILRKEKAEKRGSFKKRIILEQTI